MAGPNVLMFSPGFPADVGLFTRGLAEVGATVWGIGDQPVSALPAPVRAALADYRQLTDLWNATAVLAEVREALRGRSLDRIECLWEPGMEVVAHLREALGIPGMGVAQTAAFRDKERMKEVLDAAGIRTPRHARALTAAEVREAAERIGFPVIVKPIAGAGAADTHRCADEADLDRVLQLVRHVPQVSVEEFIEGEEYTFDTVCAGGEPLFTNISWYRPNPLLMRQNPWISPVSVTLRDPEAADVGAGALLGRDVLRALEFESGFTHMEWFRLPSGEAVFGEIGARAPGGRLVHAMNYSADIDLFAGWAEAVCHGRLSQDTTKRYNVAVIFKRAQGTGRIERIEGLPSLMARFGPHVASIDLVPVGQPRRDFRQVVEGDGWVAVRHPDLDTTLQMADCFANELRMYAG